MTTIRRKKRSGVSLAEVMVVVSILGIMFMIAGPRITEVRSKSQLRAARQELISAFAAARTAALQKGKVSTLTLTSTTASVSVLSGLAGTAVDVYSVGFNRDLNSSLSGIGGTPMTISFDARGLVSSATPIVGTGMYRLLSGTTADTLCVSSSGVILPRSCSL